MRKIKLEHNDDTALDPACPELVTRGSLFIDGRDAGWWEQRHDGTWIAHVRHTAHDVVETSKERLIARLACDA
ncbi:MULTISPECIES: hypothetical protein [unclassified Caballeronia]|uniref:hypothetical protein n=1 Tax=unclassified Caballeronia TaxID=2646786 RepID=UPI0028599204|nr:MULTISPECIES: hypothetical protein [unclassified Caballeronia]MDR5753645.1 hypothetical protein [Caballeronia sp. LZ024]MDR5840024.1 hypothetical protein [Caballeronia sp. LZ031]